MKTKLDKVPRGFVHVATISGFAISVRKRGKLYRVRYGLQELEFYSYRDAALEIGASVLHALTCAGELDK